MAKKPLTYRQLDFQRAIRGATAEGLKVKGAEIDKAGTIKLLFDDVKAKAPDPENEWKLP